MEDTCAGCYLTSRSVWSDCSILWWMEVLRWTYSRASLVMASFLTSNGAECYFDSMDRKCNRRTFSLCHHSCSPNMANMGECHAGAINFSRRSSNDVSESTFCI